MIRSVRFLAAAAAAALLAACGGGGGSSAVSRPNITPAVPVQTPGGAVSSTASTTFAYHKSALSGATNAGAAHLGVMKIDVAMSLPHAADLATYAAQVSDPSSALYRHFLTPDELGQRFGASDADYKAAADYFTAAGLQVTGWKQKTLLRVVGPQANVEKAFGTTFAIFNSPGGTMYGPTTQPHFSAPLAVHSVSHLVYSQAWMKRNGIVSPPHGTAQAFNYGWPVQQIAAAFDYTSAYNDSFTGTGINIGVIGTGPIAAADYANYKSAFALNATNDIEQVNVTSSAAALVGGSPTATPPPTTGACRGRLPACNPEDGEAQIDTQQSAGLAPSAHVLFYLAYVPQECYDPNYPQNGACGPNETNYGPQEGISEVDDEVQQAISDNRSDILSLSYGIAEQYSDYTDENGAYNPQGVEPVQFAMLAAEGTAVFVSSGDAGALGCARPYYGTGPGVAGPYTPCVSAPAIDVNVTSVGGITTPIDASGTKIGPFTTWGVQTEHGYGATGGGLSTAVPRPAYQTGPGIMGSFRNQPDMALEADAYTGVAVVENVGLGEAGGTSVAAPEAAAMWALVLDACKRTAACTSKGTGANAYRLGNPAPFFYKIYNDATLYPATFLDITDGNNGVNPCEVDPNPTVPYPSPCPTTAATPTPGYSAGKGYDLTTGIGVPFARHLIKSVVGI